MELPIRVNVDSIEGATARHFAGTCTRMVVEFVRDCVSPAALTATLTRAGETRSLAELCDDTNWSSYDRFRRLLEAAAVTVGGPRELIRVGTDGRINSAESTADFTDMLQALGSPSALYATIPEAAHAMTALNEVTSEEIGPNEWLSIAAKGNYDRPRLAPADTDSRTRIFRLRGSDLADFLAGKISRDEALERIEVKVF